MIIYILYNSFYNYRIDLLHPSQTGEYYEPKHPHLPVERSGLLDSSIRRWLQNPQKILRPYVKEGMVVLEVGCGPGFFTLDIARMVAVDLQEGMLQKVRDKV
ncbi:MAG: class I SAM-dependent methyltransferase [Methanolobus sp.]|uniref:class I SAM-dependent methyltransferase n=1 Tax=Methanolobus sp. TaxID=1874737 RepID=UPI0027319A2F|nr:class I SAM-dependent methyltransferase [Methanolobus sp.]MDP2215825.1 class I SAM-dependent methyltransferase [Methanolobus sp.]